MSVPAARGADEISVARDRHRALQEQIEAQKALLAELRADEEEIRAALTETKEELGAINADQGAVRAEVRSATASLDRVEGRYRTLVDQISQLDWTLGILEEELRQGAEDLAARRRLLGQRLAEAYRTQQTTLLEEVLDAGSFADVFASEDAHLRFGDQDAELAAQIEQDQVSLEALRRLTIATRYRADQLRQEAQARAGEIRTERARLREAQAQLQTLEDETKRLQAAERAQFERIASSREEAAQYLRDQQAAKADLRAQIADLVAAAQRRAEEEERQRDEAARRAAQEQARRAEVRRQAEERRQREQDSRAGRPDAAPRPTPRPAPKPPPRPNGPLAWPTRGYVTQEYGCTGFAWNPPRGNCPNFHDGIDIANGAGSLIRSAANGVVAFVGYNPYDRSNDRSWVVTIAHARGIVTWYMHLQPRYAPRVRAGASVRRGQVIGYMGMTGRATGVHLHWEVLQNGNTVNPRKLV